MTASIASVQTAPRMKRGKNKVLRETEDEALFCASAFFDRIKHQASVTDSNFVQNRRLTFCGL